MALQLRDCYHRTMGVVRHGDSTTSQCERGATGEAFTQQEKGCRAQHSLVDLATSQHERAAGANRDTQLSAKKMMTTTPAVVDDNLLVV